MIIDKSIFIQNIYYMLTYAFQVLKQKNYEKISGEKFDNIENLFASILSTGLAQQLKQGLHREYVAINDNLNTVRGKINLSETIKNKIKHKKHLKIQMLFYYFLIFCLGSSSTSFSDMISSITPETTILPGVTYENSSFSFLDITALPKGELTETKAKSVF